MEFHDFVGCAGAATILLAYFFLQAKKISSESYGYFGLNLIGALLILFSLAYCWNLTAVIMEVVWGAISIFGMIRRYKEQTSVKSEMAEERPLQGAPLELGPRL